MIANVPRGLYRNTQGAELRVTATACQPVTGHNTLSGDIAVAEPSNGSWHGAQYLVTVASLKDAGYELIDPEAT